MSRIKLLLDVVNDMRSLADSTQAVCDPIYKKLGFEDKAQKYTDMRLKL